MEKIVVGISGGVDSFVTALMLRQQGYEVIGVNLDLWSTDKYKEETGAEELCAQIGIPFYRVDGKELFFNAVVKTFIRDYSTGKTPNPCALCNSLIKWELLKRFADKEKIRSIATGHYVRICAENGHYYIRKGVDKIKDQSYFLWGVQEEILRRAVTPLGEYTKNEVKEIARTNGFAPLAQKRESSGICFLHGTDYRAFILKHTKVPFFDSFGEILDCKGNQIGEHKGVLNYTIGQKRDIPSQNGVSQYVSSIDVGHNRIIVGDKASLYRTRIAVGDIHFIDPEEISANDITIKVRGLGLNPQEKVTARSLSARCLILELTDPAWAVAPGQPVVFYRGERLIGGGIAQ